MVNPGCITLASLNNHETLKFPYRFCIEDNIGESIHIHYKDIRLDFTVQEFEALAEKTACIINDLVSAEGFDCRQIDPIHLVGISGNLVNLQKIECRELYLEEILVDTFDSEGNVIFAPVNQSRVFKALCGLSKENDLHTIQLNHFSQKSTEHISNFERVQFNLKELKKHGYPYKENYILVDAENKINDGQHRAACLYWLYGNIKIPVKSMIYGDNAEKIRNKESTEWISLEHNLWEKTQCVNVSVGIKHKIKTKLKSMLKSIWIKSNAENFLFQNQFQYIKKELESIEEKLNTIQMGGAHRHKKISFSKKHFSGFMFTRLEQCKRGGIDEHLILYNSRLEYWRRVHSFGYKKTF